LHFQKRHHLRGQIIAAVDVILFVCMRICQVESSFAGSTFRNGTMCTLNQKHIPHTKS
jgi:hypothetical protein